MRIAIQGCGHGDLNAIYAAMERAAGNAVDLLIICGDFQAIRHSKDLQSLACPPKYKRMGDFSQYYKGERKAPVLTLFIGGNHEASAHMWELYHGGWVAPNMYFLGFSGVVRYGGLRIGGISGIHDPRHYPLGYYERPPFTKDHEEMRSIYHTREWEVKKLAMIKEPLDIFISHEWPLGIYKYGDVNDLLRRKPFFKDDIVGGKGIGSPHLATLIDTLKVTRWFAAHMHVRFEAQVGDTRFLALDKCLPRRQHIEIIDMPHTGDLKLEYDAEWLSIVKAVNPFMNFTNKHIPFPTSDDILEADEHRRFVNENILRGPSKMRIPRDHIIPSEKPGKRTTHLQTGEFCNLLKIQDYWNKPLITSKSATVTNPDRITL